MRPYIVNPPAELALHYQQLLIVGGIIFIGILALVYLVYRGFDSIIA